MTEVKKETESEFRKRIHRPESAERTEIFILYALCGIASRPYFAGLPAKQRAIDAIELAEQVLFELENRKS